MTWSFTADLFAWGEEPGSWHFVQLPADIGDEIRECPTAPRGFGSVRVRVRAGATGWATSVFPDKSSGSYVLPVKKQVREAEGLLAGDPVHLDLELEDDLS
ncbi:DUF1905 domain-containing protein [Nocardioides cavernaquae]|uniref:DUF1905 domain-containing protein n=1 Tax=Nocardioides cavernaquae TaxID=2321396 RepID=A0A3A5HA44_9ACTN|nr:DUF1905 domain-containing protein [Nocardioides cavernaquae]RJS47232.1 DUF1905 domain-containing protein [Nocardioides cavernaquae]